MSRMLSKMNLISVVQQLSKEDIETIQGYVEMIEEENQKLKLQLSGTTFCYDEEEHRELKKQLEDANEKIILLQASEPMLNLKKALEKTKQKEFINYLQKEINSYTSHIEAIDSVCSSIYSSDYDDSKVKLAIYKEILQKYKEIVNGTEQN